MADDNNQLINPEEEFSCSSCGKTVGASAKFCPHCGEKFGDEGANSEETNFEPPSKISLVANKTVEGTICKLCNDTINFGDEIAKCDRCSSIYHNSCWEEKEGCNTKSCLSGRVGCKFCGTLIKSDAVICKNCGRDQSSGEMFNSVVPGPLPDASNALIWAIVGLFCCGIILGPVAISKGNDAKRVCDDFPGMYTNRGKAEAAVVIGWIALGLNILGLIMKIGSLGKY
jgi:RNA polymerase subunit RPABC4/transcription elongation factor Spt4